MSSGVSSSLVQRCFNYIYMLKLVVSYLYVCIYLLLGGPAMKIERRVLGERRSPRSFAATSSLASSSSSSSSTSSRSCEADIIAAAVVALAAAVNVSDRIDLLKWHQTNKLNIVVVVVVVVVVFVAIRFC